MFGMTKKQFLKRTSICLDETGSYALLMRDLHKHEETGKFIHKEVYKELMVIMDGISKEFSRYEALNPPSKCVPLQLKLLRCLILLQESASANYDYVNLSKKEDESVKRARFEDSVKSLEEFRKEFRPITSEVDQLLMHGKKERSN